MTAAVEWRVVAETDLSKLLANRYGEGPTGVKSRRLVTTDEDRARMWFRVLCEDPASDRVQLQRRTVGAWEPVS